MATYVQVQTAREAYFMRSITFAEFGSPARVLNLLERPSPQPGPGEVRVRMVMSPIHNHDLMIVTGHYGYKPALPAYPGTEAVGVVEALGEGVSHLQVGQRVAGGASATWADSYIADAVRVVPVPDSVDDETACQLVSMPLSAAMLLHGMTLNQGDWIIVNAASGAVGKLVAQFGAEQGINVLSLVRRDSAVADLERFGVGNVVSTESKGWQGRVIAATKGAPIRYGVESIGGRAADELLALLGEGGTLISFGALSGRPMQISPDNLLFKDTTVKAFWLAKLMRTTDAAVIGKLLGEIVTRAASGKLKLPVSARFDLADVAKAAEAATTPGRDGKVVLTA